MTPPLGTSEDVAVAFLAPEAARCITGTTIDVDGGMSAAGRSATRHLAR